MIGCNLTVISRYKANFELLEKWQSGRNVMNHPDQLAALMDDPADVVVEVTGSVEGFATARQLVRPAGTLVLKSTFAGEPTPIDLSSLVVDEITVVGSRCGPFEPALRLLQNDQVHVKEMIVAEYSLRDAVAAMEHASQRGVLKVLIRPDAATDGAGTAV